MLPNVGKPCKGSPLSTLAAYDPSLLWIRTGQKGKRVAKMIHLPLSKYEIDVHFSPAFRPARSFPSSARWAPNQRCAHPT